MSQHRPEIAEGTPVLVLKWGNTGTVTRREGDDVFVAYHGSFVEDQLDLGDVQALTEPTAEQAAWRGGVGALTPDGWAVAPVRPA